MPKLPTALDNMSDQLSSRSDCQVDSAATDLWRRYHELQSVEKQKNALIEELLYRYDSLSEHFKKEVEDHDREREYNRIAQRSLKDMEATILNLKDNMVRTNTDSACPTSAQAYTDQDRDAFVLVLIDGDGLIVSPPCQLSIMLLMLTRKVQRPSFVRGCQWWPARCWHLGGRRLQLRPHSNQGNSPERKGHCARLCKCERPR